MAEPRAIPMLSDEDDTAAAEDHRWMFLPPTG